MDATLREILAELFAYSQTVDAQRKEIERLNKVIKELMEAKDKEAPSAEGRG